MQTLESANTISQISQKCFELKIIRLTKQNQNFGTSFFLITWPQRLGIGLSFVSAGRQEQHTQETVSEDESASTSDTLSKKEVFIMRLWQEQIVAKPSFSSLASLFCIKNILRIKNEIQKLLRITNNVNLKIKCFVTLRRKTPTRYI